MTGIQEPSNIEQFVRETWGEANSCMSPNDRADAVLLNLEADHEYLLEGGVFTPDVIETWVDYKRANEVDPIRLRPHPHEFAMYYDV